MYPSVVHLISDSLTVLLQGLHRRIPVFTLVSTALLQAVFPCLDITLLPVHTHLLPLHTKLQLINNQLAFTHKLCLTVHHPPSTCTAHCLQISNCYIIPWECFDCNPRPGNCGIDFRSGDEKIPIMHVCQNWASRRHGENNFDINWGPQTSVYWPLVVGAAIVNLTILMQYYYEYHRDIDQKQIWNRL